MALASQRILMKAEYGVRKPLTKEMKLPKRNWQS
jgi:hypothetical protein